jgi:glutamate dehydrogenase/leucine dehydrogenase
MDKIISRAFEKSYAMAQSKNTGMRLASLMMGVCRVADAAESQGLYP